MPCDHTKIILLVMYLKKFPLRFQQRYASIIRHCLFFFSFCVVGIVYLYSPGEYETTPTLRAHLPSLLFSYFSFHPSHIDISLGLCRTEPELCAEVEAKPTTQNCIVQTLEVLHIRSDNPKLYIIMSFLETFY